MKSLGNLGNEGNKRSWKLGELVKLGNWKFRRLETWEIGNLENWKAGKFKIRGNGKSENLENGNSENQKLRKLKTGEWKTWKNGTHGHCVLGNREN